MRIRIEKFSVDEVMLEETRTSSITEVVPADLWLVRDWLHADESMAALMVLWRVWFCVWLCLCVGVWVGLRGFNNVGE